MELWSWRIYGVEIYDLLPKSSRSDLLKSDKAMYFHLDGLRFPSDGLKFGVTV